MKAVFENLKTFDLGCKRKYKLTGEILMENAGRGICEFLHHYIKKHLKKRPSVQIVCGSGDNGADGLVLARMLLDFANVQVVQVAEPKSELCILQMQRLKLLNIEIVKNISNCDILVDAFLGTGFKGLLREDAIKVINTMNKTKAFKIACDVPSGLSIKGIPSPVATIVDVTISAGALKLCFFSDDAKDYVGKIKTISLGLPSDSYAPKKQTDYFLLQKTDLKLPHRKKQNTYKGMFGHAGICCGEKEGAAILAGLSCLKFGAGLVTLFGKHITNLPPDLMQTIQTTVDKKYSVYCFGPGLGIEAEKVIGNFIKELKQEKNDLSDETNLDTKVVFDADALKTFAFAENIDRFNNCIITPHPKEFLSLLTNLSNCKKIYIENIDKVTVDLLQKDRFTFAKKFSINFPNIVLVLKGSNTIIASAKKFFICNVGSPSLSKAGTGDVLSGMITALLAQGYNSLDAAMTSVFSHAYASKTASSYGLTASELVNRISKFKNIKGKNDLRFF